MGICSLVMSRQVRADEYAEDTTIYVYKILKKLREKVTDIKEPCIEGKFPLERSSADMTHVMTGDMTQPEEYIQYQIPAVMAAFIKGDTDWLKAYGSRADLLEGADKGAVYVDDSIYDHSRIIYALWARLLWLEPDSDVRTDFFKLIASQYSAAGQRKRTAMLSFFADTLVSIPYIDQKETAADMFRVVLPELYNGWVVHGEFIQGLPFNMVFAKEALAYSKAGSNAGVENVKKSVEAMIGRCAIGYDKSLPYCIRTSLRRNFMLTDEASGSEEIMPDDDYVRQIRALHTENALGKYDRALISLFESELWQLDDQIRPEHYVSVLNKLWSDIEGGALGSDGDTEKKNDIYIAIIKKELKKLDKDGIDVREMYMKNYIGADMKRFMFYRNELTDKSDPVIGINSLKRIGIPEDVEKKNNADVFDMNATDEKVIRRNRVILDIWRKCDIRIQQDNRLYEYQKELVTRCSEETLLAAAECGIFPKRIRHLLVEWAVERNCWDVVPVLIWIERGCIDEN